MNNELQKLFVKQCIKSIKQDIEDTNGEFLNDDFFGDLWFDDLSNLDIINALNIDKKIKKMDLKFNLNESISKRHVCSLSIYFKYNNDKIILSDKLILNYYGDEIELDVNLNDVLSKENISILYKDVCYLVNNLRR